MAENEFSLPLKCFAIPFERDLAGVNRLSIFIISTMDILQHQSQIRILTTNLQVTVENKQNEPQL